MCRTVTEHPLGLSGYSYPGNVCYSYSRPPVDTVTTGFCISVLSLCLTHMSAPTPLLIKCKRYNQIMHIRLQHSGSIPNNACVACET